MSIGPSTNIVVRGNNFQGGTYGAQFTDGPVGVLIEGNTFSGQAGPSLQIWANGFLVRNNLFLGSGRQHSNQAAIFLFQNGPEPFDNGVISGNILNDIFDPPQTDWMIRSFGSLTATNIAILDNRVARKSDSGGIYSLADGISGVLDSQSPIMAPEFIGSGAMLASLDASNISAGVVDDDRLSENVALLSRDQTFAGRQLLTHPENELSGDGSRLTNLPQSPWRVDIDAGGNSLTNLANIHIAGSFVAAVDSLSSAAMVVTDAALGNHFRITADQDFTLADPTNPTDGQQVTWEIIQDGTGSRMMTLDTAFVLGGDVKAITLTTTPQKRDFLTAVYNAGTEKWYVINFVTGY